MSSSSKIGESRIIHVIVERYDVWQNTKGRRMPDPSSHVRAYMHRSDDGDDDDDEVEVEEVWLNISSHR